jgi:hypothetical protein
VDYQRLLGMKRAWSQDSGSRSAISAIRTAPSLLGSLVSAVPPLPPHTYRTSPHLFYFAPPADALCSASCHGLHHSSPGVSPSRGGGNSVWVGGSGLRWGHGGDQGGLHQPLQIRAGGDSSHRGNEVGTGDRQIRAEVLKQNRRELT